DQRDPMPIIINNDWNIHSPGLGAKTLRWDTNGNEVVSQSYGPGMGGEMPAPGKFYPVTIIEGPPPMSTRETSLNYINGSSVSLTENGGGDGGVALSLKVQDGHNDTILIQQIPAGMGDGQQWKITINGQVLNVDGDWLKSISVSGSGLDTTITLNTSNGPLVLSRNSSDAYDQLFNLIQANK
ncbi:MAG: hypothetical protein ACRD3W_26230, partial [Terriglobales bacterium]